MLIWRHLTFVIGSSHICHRIVIIVIVIINIIAIISSSSSSSSSSILAIIIIVIGFGIPERGSNHEVIKTSPARSLSKSRSPWPTRNAPLRASPSLRLPLFRSTKLRHPRRSIYIYIYIYY